MTVSQDHFMKNTRGRYELNGFELTSGDAIEVKRGEQWERGRIEFNWEQQKYVVLLALGGTMAITPTIQARKATQL